MNQKQAKKALKEGFKVSHKHFSPKESFKIERMKLPEGTNIDRIIENLFVKYRNNPSYFEGWFIFLTDSDRKAIHSFFEENLSQDIEESLIENIRITDSIARFFYKNLTPYIAPDTKPIVRAYINSLNV